MSEQQNPYRLDAAESVFFARQLEYIKSRTYDEKLAELRYQKFLPISQEAGSGATEITYRSFRGFGMAKLISDYAHDYPRVDIGGTEVTVKVKNYGISYHYNILEIRRAAKAGLNLEQRRANAARRATEQKLNTVAWLGDSVAGLQGFIKYPGTTEYTLPADGTGVSKLWTTKTPDLIIRDLNGLVNAVVITTKGVESIDTILMPIAQLTYLKNTRMGSNTDTTIYKFFTDNNPGITLDWVQELDNAGTGGTIDVIVAYKRDPEHVTFEVPNFFEAFEADKEGLSYKVPCIATTAGVIVYYPLSVAWAEGL